MADYILEIAEPGRHISVSRGFVLVSEGNKEIGRVAVDTLSAVLLSTEGATLSKSFFERMGSENIPVIICGKDYLPISIATPLSSYYRPLSVAQKQIALSPVRKKHLWKAIVAAKIENQARVLAQKCPHTAQESIHKLQTYTRTIKSGDSDNKEAQAAKVYWQALFGKAFSRNPEMEGINTFLNYGYAIVRGAVTRAICATGMLPMFGLHHRNTYNAFCLADDLMEPLRPLLDALVFDMQAEKPLADLNPEYKRALSRVLQAPCLMGKESTSLVPATRLTAQSLVRAFSQSNTSLDLPFVL